MSDFTAEQIEAALNGTGDVVEEETAPVEEAVEAPVEEPPAETPEAEEPAPALEDDWEAKFKKLQSVKDRETREAQLEAQRVREELAELKGRQAALQEHQEASKTSEVQNVTLEDLRSGVENNLAATFQWTAVNRPDMVSKLITMVREHEGLGNATADEMVVEYNRYLQQQSQAEIEARYQELQDAREADQAPLRSQQAMEDVVGSLTERFGENFTAVQDEIARRLETDGRQYVEYLRQVAQQNGEDPDSVVTPSLLRDMMVDIYLEIRENALNSATSVPAEPSEVPAAAAALNGSHSGAREPEDDSYLGDFMRGAMEANISVDPKFLP